MAKKTILEQDVEVKGVVKKLFNGCPKPNGWFGGWLRTVDEDIRVTGVCLEPITVGTKLVVRGNLVYSEGWGEQIEANSVEICLESDRALVQYLSGAQFPGIGHRTAKKVVDVFGPSTLDMILNNSSLVQSRCGLTDKQMMTLLDGVRSKNMSNQLVLKYPHLTPLWAARIAKLIEGASNGFDNDVSVVFRQIHVRFSDVDKSILDNPYCLLKMGVPFPIADSVALLDCQLAWDDYRRVDCIFFMELTKFMNRNSCTYVNLSDNTDTNDFREALAERLCGDKYDGRVSDQFVSDTIVRLAKDELVYLDGTLQPEVHLYDLNMKQIETKIIYEVMHHLKGGYLDSQFSTYAAKCVKKAMRLFSDRKRRGVFSLCKEQEDAVYYILENSLSCLTGGPGRGKTSVMKALADAWTAAYPSGDVVMLAPTGKAVNRMKEATGWCESQTVSRFLYMNLILRSDVTEEKKSLFLSNRLGDFSICKNNSTLIIVDESSMLDFSEAATLLGLCHDCHIVFVGDVSQLPPIEPGPFLHQLITSGVVPVFELQLNHRSRSKEISLNADKILAGDSRFQITNNFQLAPMDDNHAVDFVVNRYQTLLQNGLTCSDILLMSPINKRGVGSVSDINARLQAVLNPENLNQPQLIFDKRRSLNYYDLKGWTLPVNPSGGLKFRIMDRVMNTKNHAGDLWSKYRDDNPDSVRVEQGCGYFNGDTGTILRYYMAGSVDESPFVMILLDDGRIIDVSVEDFHEWVFGYCVTIHKSQGCEAEECMIVFSSYLNTRWFMNGKFLTKNLLYTGVTRAKGSVSIIGNMQALKQCVKSDYEYRNVALSKYLNQVCLPYLVQQSLKSNV